MDTESKEDGMVLGSALGRIHSEELWMNILMNEKMRKAIKRDSER